MIEVDAVSLDSFSREHIEPTLIKIDIEGGEAAALLGGERIFTSHRPILICDVHNKQTDEYITQWLISKRYSLTSVEDSSAFPRHLLAKAPS